MMYYEKYGEAGNKTIIFLHGMNFVHCFTKQIPHFSKNYQVLVPHLPGFGRSSDAVFSVDTAVSEITELAGNIGRPAVLVGFSLGAQLCLPLICGHAELFDGAVMVSPWLIKDVAEIEKLMKQQSDNEKNMRSGALSLSVGLGKEERQEHKEYCKNVSMKSILAAVDNGITLDGSPQYPDVDMPMLAVCGMKDSVNIRKSTRMLSQKNPHCSYDMWDGAGHNIPYKFASRFNKTLDGFMEKTGQFSERN